MEIAGPGAVWPELTPEEISKEISLKVRAGSSGRPNKASELANMERAMPYLLQMPGVNPAPVVKKYLDLLEIDSEDVILEGLPSITAMNAMMSRGIGMTQGAGSPNDPNQQGDKGPANNKSTQQNEEGAQPAYPAA
jgi:hypothetical protein